MSERAVELGSETVLVVDDEPMALHFCVSALKRAGYNVFSASSGREAINFFQPNRSPVDLALIDIVMPGMSGIELAGRLERLGIRVVLMSGYSPEEVKKMVGEDASQRRSMWKPFVADTLVQMIKNALDAPAPKKVFEQVSHL